MGPARSETPRRGQGSVSSRDGAKLVGLELGTEDEGRAVRRGQLVPAGFGGPARGSPGVKAGRS